MIYPYTFPEKKGTALIILYICGKIQTYISRARRKGIRVTVIVPEIGEKFHRKGMDINYYYYVDKPVKLSVSFSRDSG